MPFAKSAIYKINAVARCEILTKLHPSSTASIIPATKAAQLRLPKANEYGKTLQVIAHAVCRHSLNLSVRFNAQPEKSLNTHITISNFCLLLGLVASYYLSADV